MSWPRWATHLQERQLSPSQSSRMSPARTNWMRSQRCMWTLCRIKWWEYRELATLKWPMFKRERKKEEIIIAYMENGGQASRHLSRLERSLPGNFNVKLNFSHINRPLGTGFQVSRLLLVQLVDTANPPPCRLWSKTFQSKWTLMH